MHQLSGIPSTHDRMRLTDLLAAHLYEENMLGHHPYPNVASAASVWDSCSKEIYMFEH